MADYILEITGEDAGDLIKKGKNDTRTANAVEGDTITVKNAQAIYIYPDGGTYTMDGETQPEASLGLPCITGKAYLNKVFVPGSGCSLTITAVF